MVIHKCDRCGIETDNPHTIFYQADLAGATSKSTELCDKCYSEFVGWLNDDDLLLPQNENWRKVMEKMEKNGG